MSPKIPRNDALTITHLNEWSDMRLRMAERDASDEEWRASHRIGLALEGLDDLRYLAMERHDEIRGILRDITLALT